MTRERIRALKLIAVLIPLLGAAWIYGPAETPWSCDEQVKMAQDLSQNSVLAAIDLDYLKVETYRSYPCKEGSEGDSISAGKVFTTSTTLTMKRLQAISNQAIRAQDWVKVATLGTTDPGSGGDSTICYHAKRSDQNLYLQIASSPPDEPGQPTDESTGPSQPQLFVDLAQVSANETLCDY